MGTCNFHNKNASHVFAVLTSYEESYKECEDCGEKHWGYDYNLNEIFKCTECDGALGDKEEESKCPEDYEYEDLKINLRDEMKTLPYDVDMANEHDNERSYCGTMFADVRTGKDYGDQYVEVRIKCIIRSAYYDGANLDWEIEYYDGGDWFESADDIEFVGYSDMNAGMATIQQGNARSWAESMSEEMVEAVEKVYKKWSSAYNHVGTFSNGEGVYEKVED